MANLHETVIRGAKALGWVFAASVVVVTAGAWMAAYSDNDVPVSTTVLHLAGLPR